MFPDGFYENLRRAVLSDIRLCETDNAAMSRFPLQERLLYPLWVHQRVVSERLCTAEGEKIRVYHPGFRSVSGGPDFQDALIAFGGNPPELCDVEIDLDPSCWRGHNHDTNSAFAGVGLEVVWKTPDNVDRVAMQKGIGRRVLVLSDFLDAPEAELLEWGGSDEASLLSDNVLGSCAECVCRLEEEDWNSFLSQAAMVKLKCKTAFISATARIFGWEQALYIHLMRGLGYKQNTLIFQRLGEMLKPQKVSVLTMQALLLGIAGMIPDKLSEKDQSLDAYITELWSVWWRHLSAFSDLVMPRNAWRLSGTRPINHPQRRLALASYWLSEPNFCHRLEDWSLSSSVQVADVKAALESLYSVLLPSESDAFWGHHYTMQSAATKKALPLLGGDRVVDLFINVIVPWFMARTDRAHIMRAWQGVQQCYFKCPASSSKRIYHIKR